MNFKFTEDEQSIISRMHEFGGQEAGPLRQKSMNRNVFRRKTGNVWRSLD